MRTGTLSKQDILKVSRRLIRQQGWPAITIRSVAAACGVSVGSIYNYFDSKAALVEETVESVWHEIFHHFPDEREFQDTQACVIWLYERMALGSRQYPDFFTLHSPGLTQDQKAEGKRRMQQTWQHILKELALVLKRDEKIRPEALTAPLSAESFADILFSLMLSALLRQDFDPSPVLEIIRRTLYDGS